MDSGNEVEDVEMIEENDAEEEPEEEPEAEEIEEEEEEEPQPVSQKCSSGITRASLCSCRSGTSTIGLQSSTHRMPTKKALVLSQPYHQISGTSQ